MSAFSVHEPFPQFHDRDGQPLDGGFVFIGTAGLDAQANQVPVYFDPALTIPASQPIQTHGGFAANGATPTPIYVDANDYSIKVLDANGALVIAYPNAVDRFPAAVITGGLSSANVTYDRALTGTQLRTVEGRLRDFTSVFDFMTPTEIAGVQAGTFLVDVTAPIQAALNSGAREVYFPQGGYLISSTLTINSVTVAKMLRGAGRQSSIIYSISAGNAIESIGNPITQNTSITIADLNIEGQPGTGNGIFFEYTSQATIERVGLYGHGADGIRVENGAHIAIVDCWSRSNTGNALRIGGEAYFVDVRGGTFESSQDGVEIDIAGGAASPRFLTFTGCAFRGNTNANVNVGQSRDVRFFGCSFESPAGSATVRHLSVDGGVGLASSVVADACSFTGVNGALTTVGVYAATCEDVAVTNSVIDCTGATAYNVAASAVRTRFFDNAVIVGTQTNASASTFTRTTLTGSSSLGFGGGEGLVNFDALANAMKMRRVPVSNLPAAGTTQLGVLQLRALDSAGLLSSEYRVWSRGGNLVGSLTDPANITDGITIGPGVQTYTFATRPASAPVGTIVRITDSNAALTWGQVETGGGIINRFIIHTGGNVWTVIGNG
jgi:hypothetical protein